MLWVPYFLAKGPGSGEGRGLGVGLPSLLVPDWVLGEAGSFLTLQHSEDRTGSWLQGLALSAPGGHP